MSLMLRLLRAVPGGLRATGAAVSIAGPQRSFNHGGFAQPPPASVWIQILQRASEDQEKLREIVRDLKIHCDQVHCAPPLEVFNELLRLCNYWHDSESLLKLVSLINTRNMQVDKVTYSYLSEGFTYFPRSFAHTAAQMSHTTMSSSSSSSSNSSSSMSGGGSSSHQSHGASHMRQEPGVQGPGPAHHHAHHHHHSGSRQSSLGGSSSGSGSSAAAATHPPSSPSRQAAARPTVQATGVPAATGLQGDVSRSPPPPQQQQQQQAGPRSADCSTEAQ